MASTSCDHTPFGEAESAGSDYKDDVEKDKRCLQKRKSICEIVFLSVAIGVVWCLMILPIIFWHLPVNVQTNITTCAREECNSTVRYSNTTEHLPCRQDFFRSEESGVCIPNCATWSEYSRSEVILTDVLIILLAVIGLIAGSVVLILATVRFKRMCTFPAIFLVYLTIDFMILDSFLIISHFDRSSLYCSSPDLPQSILNPTPFCVITGVVLSYLLLQIAFWWLSHATIILWKLQFPFHARSFENSGKMKYVHIISIVVGLFLPLVSPITSMVDFAVDLSSSEVLQSQNISFVSGGLGYGLIRFPSILCSAIDRYALYYSNVLPINLMVIVGITELILVFRIIHKQYGLFRLAARSSNTKHPQGLGMAERKILIVLCYYVVFASFSLTQYTVVIRNLDAFDMQLDKYFICELNGHDPSNPCDRNKFRQLSNPGLTALTYILLGLFPLFNLIIYALNYEELLKRCRACFKGKS